MDGNKTGGSKVAQMLWVVGTPVIVFTGVFGNILTIIVLSRKQNKRTSTSTYLQLLAWADLVIMLTVPTRWWIIYTFGVDVRLKSNFICKSHWFVTYFFTIYSALMLLIVTVERVLSTTKPYKVKMLCNKKSAIRIAAVTAVAVCCFVGHVFYGFNLERYKVTEILTNTTAVLRASENDTDNVQADLNRSVSTDRAMEDITYFEYTCLWTRHDDYAHFYTDIFQVMINVIYNIVPQMFFFIGGIIIIRTLAKSRNIHNSYSNYGSRPSKKPGRIRSHSTQITITLLLVNIVFFFCTTPVQIFMTGRKYWIDLNKGMNGLQEIIWAICNLLFYTNHAINFILYFLSGMKFRSEVIALFKCKDRRSLVDNAHTISNIASVSEQVSPAKGINNVFMENVYDVE